MKTKKYNLLTRFMAAFCAAFLIASPVWALDVQTLPTQSAATWGFTHAARITSDDLDNADASALTIQLFAIPTNSYIDRVAFFVEENFTNAAYVPTLGATNLVINIGVGGTTNAFFGSNTLTYARFSLSTNMLVPYKATTSTNYLIANFSDGLQASEVDGYVRGKIRIYWRVVQPSKYNF
jgi:hypothetical protein